ncbi:hypothetical protein D3C71_1256100 [compost metagenome]
MVRNLIRAQDITDVGRYRLLRVAGRFHARLRGGIDHVVILRIGIQIRAQARVVKPEPVVLFRATGIALDVVRFP